MRMRSLIGFIAAVVVATALVSSSGAATPKGSWVARIDVSTRSAVVHYLRSIHVNPSGVVIQRGFRNYAGPSCPGKGWSCTETTRPVVQVATAGGHNAFSCSAASCAVVQVATTAAPINNSATCIKHHGRTQKCAITQSSVSGNNLAVIYENASTSAGMTQTVSQVAAITQTTGGAGSNTACVTQSSSLIRSALRKHGEPLVVKQEVHQTATITQDAAGTGGNSASDSATPSGGCGLDPLGQSQSLAVTMNTSGSITERQNAVDKGANMTIDIEQNQGSAFGVGSGPNTARFDQTNSLTAIANSANGPISQIQSSLSGGILGTVNQDSSGISTATTTQTETQCEDAATAGLTSCDTSDGDFAEAPPSLTQIQYGPVRKGVGQATQTGNSGDTFSVTQSSTQNDDQGAGSQQTNVVEGDCHTSGNCSVSQTTTVNGQTYTNGDSGQDVDVTTDCTGSACTTEGGGE